MELKAPRPAPQRALDDEQRAKVAAERTGLLIANLPLSAAVTIVIALLLAHVLRDQVSQKALALWSLAIVVVSLMRVAIWHFWQRDDARHDNAAWWMSAFALGAFAAGCVWGSASIWIFPADSIAHQVFLGFVLASMAAGGISTLAVNLKSYVIFLLPTLMPYSARLLLEGGELQGYMSVVFLLGLGFLLINARRFETATVNALLLHLENTRLVEALRSALAEAESANRTKSQFLAKMSYELRTPLSGMLGMAELLLKTTLSERQRHLSRTFSQSARSLLALVEDLLDVSRIESGNFELQNEEFDLRACIEDTVEICASAGYSKGLEVHLIIPEPLPRRIKGNARRLHQVLVNLIGSSVKQTDVGQISLRVACTRTDRKTFDLVFSIQDNGFGLSQEDMAQLFAPLTAASAGNGRGPEGSDMSLAVTRFLVDIMGGTVTLSSQTGKGTNIRLALRMDAADVHADDLEPQLEQLSGKRVLILDDRLLSRETIASCLQAPGAHIDFACSDAEALAKLRRAAGDGAPYHLAVIDRVRPRTGNLALHRKIISSPDLSATRVIALMPMRWSLDEATEAEFGSGAFVSKPLRRSSLIAAIERLFPATRPPESPTVAPTVAPTGTAPPSTLPAADQCRLGGLKVLVAEDNPVNQEVALAYLEDFGCAATLAANGLEAINAFEKESYDIVLMDCQMPEVDGLAAIRHIRSREARLGLRPTPIVVVTANAFASDRENAFAAGADGFLTKPYDEQQLIQAMAGCQHQRAEAA